MKDCSSKRAERVASVAPLPQATFSQPLDNSVENEEKLCWLVGGLDSGYTIPKKCNFGNIDFSFCRTLVVAFIIDHFFHFWNAVSDHSKSGNETLAQP